jgi:molybdate transport system ATP-binding protein
MTAVEIRKQLRDFDLQVSFQVPEQQCVALVGPTGCGKTTVLRLLSGLLEPDAGTISFGGRVVVDTTLGVCLSPQQRRVGVVFQDYCLFPHMTVLQNVAYGARARGASRGEARETALGALERVGLTAHAGVRPTRLSGGQQQRVALARALASGPELLLMDEPLAALDPTVRRQVRSELKSFIADVGIQTIIVTHDVVDALTLGDQICVMDQGQIIQSGDRRELLSRPRNAFVAEFLGVNLLTCQARPGRDGLYEAVCGALTFYTIDEAEGEAMLRCNPWDVSLSREEPTGSALNVLRGRVSQLAHIGGRTRVTIEDGVSLVAELTHMSEEQLDLKLGDMVYAAFKASATHVYQ